MIKALCFCQKFEIFCAKTVFITVVVDDFVDLKLNDRLLMKIRR